MKTSPKIAVFPGTFDPMTNGHLDVIRRGSQLFDQLIVAIGHNPNKAELFTVEERRDMVSRIIGEVCPDAKVATFEGLTVDYARSVGATVILRGLRNVTDLHYEFQLALTNRAVADIETVFIMTGETYGFTSSSLIKQIASAGEVDRLHRLLPPLVLEKIKEKKLHGGGRLLRRHRPDEFKE
jgi:pantetheine-phosphate adenylyltransferase